MGDSKLIPSNISRKVSLKSSDVEITFSFLSPENWDSVHQLLRILSCICLDIEEEKEHKPSRSLSMDNKSSVSGIPPYTSRDLPLSQWRRLFILPSTRISDYRVGSSKDAAMSSRVEGFPTADLSEVNRNPFVNMPISGSCHPGSEPYWWFVSPIHEKRGT
jgi:hypothetical protein